MAFFPSSFLASDYTRAVARLNLWIPDEKCLSFGIGLVDLDAPYTTG